MINIYTEDGRIKTVSYDSDIYHHKIYPNNPEWNKSWVDIEKIPKLYLTKKRYKQFKKALKIQTIQGDCKSNYNPSRSDLIYDAIKKLSYLKEKDDKFYKSNIHIVNHFLKCGQYYRPIYIDVKSKKIKDNGAYVYEYRVGGVVKYVGKGSLNITKHCKRRLKRGIIHPMTFKRARQIFQHKHCVKCLKHSHEIDIHIVKVCKSSHDAMEYESMLIDKYGLNNIWNSKG